MLAEKEALDGTSVTTPARATIGWLLLPVFLVQLAFFAFVALHRFIDGDEGFYLLASKLVLAHKKPYVDFFYNQAPLLPYVYGAWIKVVGATWTSAKVLPALLTAALGTLLVCDIYRQTRRLLAGVAALILFTSSSMIFAFFPVVKTFSLAAILLFGAYMAVSRIHDTPRTQWLLGVGGLLFGLSVDTRSYLVVLLPLFVWWVVSNSEPHRTVSMAAWFLGGSVLGVVPSFYFLVCSPSAFLFNNVGYHAIRSDSGLVGMYEQKLVVLLQLLFIGPESNGVQFSILFFVTIGFLIIVGNRKYPAQFAFLIATAVGAVSFLPTPTWPQYFCLCIPFLVVSAVCGVTDFLLTLEQQQAKGVAVAACVLMLGVYVAAGVPDWHRYLTSGDGVPGMTSVKEPADLRLERIVEVSRTISQMAAPGETVASFWPGYIFETSTYPLSGLEADYGLPISGKLTEAQRHKYHIISVSELDAHFARHEPRIVVLRDHLTMSGGEEQQKLRQTDDLLRASLLAHKYSVAHSAGGISIYVYDSK
jgi:dolichyl-phosphate-mannose-protein mannosyltransferase